MLRIAVYGRTVKQEHYESIRSFFRLMAQKGIYCSVYEPLRALLMQDDLLDNDMDSFVKDGFDPTEFRMMISMGGDGTLLDCTTFVRDSGLPLLGVNTGRLGFLSSISIESIEDALDQIVEGAYMVEKRTTLRIESDQPLFGQDNFALNELTVHKKDAQSMIAIHAYVDGKYLNTYWADGLIVATPTGSTAYSMSCGGPIILPSSSNFILTPVAPHNLNVRPVLISDQSVITLRVEGRSENFMISVDSRSASIHAGSPITVMKNNFHIHLVRLKNHSFLKTLRTKLNWGLDQRN